MKLVIFILFLSFKTVCCDLESHVLGGDKVHISMYPHSVFLNVFCESSFICGGSVLNQDIVLTAAHCLEDCKRPKDDKVKLKYGHQDLDSMRTVRMKKYIMHELYDTNTLANDIALVAPQESLRLGRNVKRVAIHRKFPESKYAYIAGWGITNTDQRLAQTLKYVSQKIQEPQVCKLIGKRPVGTFCAGSIKKQSGPARGDSGSALVISNYIQIGIVSYKVQKYSLVVYTNVSYHYRWLRRRAPQLFCRRTGQKRTF